MGQAHSAAAQVAQENKEELDKMMTMMREKLEAMLLELKLERGSNPQSKGTEVTGGRTISKLYRSLIMRRGHFYARPPSISFPTFFLDFNLAVNVLLLSSVQ